MRNRPTGARDEQSDRAARSRRWLNGAVPFVALAFAACAAHAKPYTVDPATRQKIVAQLGEEVAQDLERVYAAARDYQALPYPKPQTSYDPEYAVACVEGEITAVGDHNHGRAAEEHAALERCASSCGVEVSRPESPFHELGAKYAGRCGPSKDSQRRGAEQLTDYDRMFKTLRDRPTPLNVLLEVPQLRADLESARSGAPGTEIDSRAQALDAFEAAHADDLKRARAFVSREDVKATQSEIDLSRARINDLNATGHAQEAQLEDLHMQSLEKKYGKLAHDAGL